LSLALVTYVAISINDTSDELFAGIVDTGQELTICNIPVCFWNKVECMEIEKICEREEMDERKNLCLKIS
jgi:hypothetical protein